MLLERAFMRFKVVAGGAGALPARVGKRTLPWAGAGIRAVKTRRPIDHVNILPDDALDGETAGGARADRIVFHGLFYREYAASGASGTVMHRHSFFRVLVK